MGIRIRKWDKARRFTRSWANRLKVGSPEETKMNQPLKKISVGRVSAAIWENNATVNGKEVKILKASLERRYTDKDGNWKSSNSFSRDEIAQAIYCLGRCYDTIATEQQVMGNDEAAQ